MTLADDIYQAALAELGEGHLALDRLGAPREFWEDDIVRELTLSERIKFVFPLPLAVALHNGGKAQP